MNQKDMNDRYMLDQMTQPKGLGPAQHFRCQSKKVHPNREDFANEVVERPPDIKLWGKIDEDNHMLQRVSKGYDIWVEDKFLVFRRVPHRDVVAGSISKPTPASIKPQIRKRRPNIVNTPHKRKMPEEHPPPIKVEKAAQIFEDGDPEQIEIKMEV